MGADKTPTPQMKLAESVEHKARAQIKQVFLVRLCVSPRGLWQSLEELERTGPLELDMDTDQPGFSSQIGPH